MSIDLSKVNITHRHISGNCDDNFFLFRREYLDHFQNAIKSMKANNEITHRINHYIGEDKINYLTGGPGDVDDIIDIWRIHKT